MAVADSEDPPPPAPGDGGGLKLGKPVGGVFGPGCCADGCDPDCG